MDDTPCFNKKASAKEDKITQNKIKEALKQKINFNNGSKCKTRKLSQLTDEDTICATVIPCSDIGDCGNKEKHLNPIKSMNDINITYSDHQEYSNLMPTSSKNSERIECKRSTLLQTYSCKQLNDPREIVENFLMRQKPMKANKPRNSMVFSRLHNQALVMQKKKADIREKSKKKCSITNSKHHIMYSKSGNLKSPKFCNQNSNCAKMQTKTQRKSDTNNIEYDANAGHRLYLKSRCLSSKRERSLNKIRKEKQCKSKREKEKMAKTSLISPQSQWIVDERKYGHHYNTDREWDKKDLLDNHR